MREDRVCERPYFFRGGRRKLEGAKILGAQKLRELRYSSNNINKYIEKDFPSNTSNQGQR